MKNTFVFLFCQLLLLNLANAQTGWLRNNADSVSKKLNLVESRADGNFYRLRFYDSLPASQYIIEHVDSANALIAQTIVFNPDSNLLVKTLVLDTITQRLHVAEQSEDSVNFYLRLRIFDYSLNPLDTFLYTIARINSLEVEVAGGGIDTAGNRFIIYRSKDIFDQTWARGVCRKTATGSIKNNLLKTGQAANDGYYIHDCFVSPGGNIYIGGSRKESLFGNYFYFERLNASLSLVFEVKDQLVPNNTENNHVSSLHVYTTANTSQVVVAGTIFGLAPGDTIWRSHGVIRAYTHKGVLRWNYQNHEVRDYKKVIAKNSYVHAVGTNNMNAAGLDTKISRLFIKDGVLDWNRYYGSKSIPSCLQVERDGSILVGGDKLKNIPLPGGGSLSSRTFMLVRYSKWGKRLYDYNFAWNPPAGTSTLSGSFSDIANGKYNLYYAAGTGRIIYDSGSSTQQADSLYLQQFNNGSLRVAAISDPVASLQIHPNPAGDEIHFRCDARVVDYLLTTVQGTETTTGEVWQEGDRCHCRVSSLKPGAYILSIRTEKGWSSGRFIKE